VYAKTLSGDCANGTCLRFGKQRAHHYQSYYNELKNVKLTQAKQQVAPKIVLLEKQISVGAEYANIQLVLNCACADVVIPVLEIVQLI